MATWVKASERLPEEMKNVVVKLNDHTVRYSYQAAGKFFHDEVFCWLDESTPAIPEDVEQAAKKWAKDNIPDELEDTAEMEYCVDAYIAGAAHGQQGDFAKRVNDWMQICFGEEISKDVVERNHRFVEEALELGQACGITKSECYQLVDYVFSRPVGQKEQEVGGVLVTLAALCNAHNIDMDLCGETELSRVWTKVDKIREKQANKPKHSPLPQHAPAIPSSIVRRLEEANPYPDIEDLPFEPASAKTGYNFCLSKLRELLSSQPVQGNEPENKYKLPGHDETMGNLDNLTIKPK